MTGDAAADRLYRDRALARFYDLDNPWGPDQDYCLSLAAEATSVLDLGCGTGRLAVELARAGRRAVGVDPATAMLEIARTRPGGAAVEWVEADARDLALGERFDLIVLTGHAFQVFLAEEDQRRALAAIADHLAPEGRFIFDSRNPRAEAWRHWRPKPSRRRLEYPDLGSIEAWNDARHDPASGIVTYETHYRPTTGAALFSAESRIRFTTQPHLAALIEQAGLAVERWLGDWTGGPYTADAPEIIPLGRRDI